MSESDPGHAPLGLRVAVASGKGGTGKTTVAANLAATVVSDGLRVQLLDADVEEPNCHLFVRPTLKDSSPIEVLIPEVDEARCTLCGRCSEVCEYKAIVVLPTTVLVYNELCHSCGACALLCPEQAISEVGRAVGVLERGVAEVKGAPRGDSAGEGTHEIAFVQGRLTIGEAKPVPAVHAVAGAVDGEADVAIIDCPPGTSCPVVEAVRDSDLVVLVTEPTPFGLSDLRLAVAMVRELGQPFAVVINRADVGDDRVRRYCAEEGIPILLEIADDRRVAEAYSRGQLAIEAVPGLRQQFGALWSAVRAAADDAAGRDSAHARARATRGDASAEASSEASSEASDSTPGSKAGQS